MKEAVHSRHLCACVWGGRMYMWGPEDSLWESALSFYHMGPRDKSQAFRLGD